MDQTQAEDPGLLLKNWVLPSRTLLVLVGMAPRTHLAFSVYAPGRPLQTCIVRSRGSTSPPRATKDRTRPQPGFHAEAPPAPRAINHASPATHYDAYHPLLFVPSVVLARCKDRIYLSFVPPVLVTTRPPFSLFPSHTLSCSHPLSLCRPCLPLSLTWLA